MINLYEGLKPQMRPKALIMFATGTVGIVLGGPLAIIIVSYINVDAVTGVPGEEVWRGLTTVAGSWIGGGANQLAMKETFGVGDELFSALIAVDVIVANIWMAVLLYASGRERAIDKRTGADASAIESLKERITKYQAEILKIPNLPETMVLLAFGPVGVWFWRHGPLPPGQRGNFRVVGGDRRRRSRTLPGKD